MKVFLHYEDNDDSSLHKTLKITLPKSWKTGHTNKLLNLFVESYNQSHEEKAKLDVSVMHIETDAENDKRIPLASDAIVIDVITDRANVYICHGSSETLEEIERKRRETAQREKEERARTVQCTHFGCKNRFPRGGPYPKCQYHARPPVFHETAKFWSCCPQKKAYDWETFQTIPGCLEGVCSEEKQEEQKQFLGGCDLREELNGKGSELKSIDDFNRVQQGGAPVLERLRSVFAELDIDVELFDQVVDGLKKEHGEDNLDAIAADVGKKLKSALKVIAVEQLRIK